MLAEIAVF